MGTSFVPTAITSCRCEELTTGAYIDALQELYSEWIPQVTFCDVVTLDAEQGVEGVLDHALAVLAQRGL